MFRRWIMLIALATGMAMLKAQPEDGADLVHTVVAGDTLISIALSYGVTLDDLLSLNGLNPEALLQIGQRLVIIRSGSPIEEAGASESGDGGDAESDVLPPAPVAEADAPMIDPADMRPQLCLAVFQDDNQNGTMEPDERYLAEGSIILLDETEAEHLRYTTDGESEPYCPSDIQRGIYRIEGEAPAGYGMTGSAILVVDLRAGGEVSVDFGAKQGLATSIVPTPDPQAGKGEAQAGESSSLLYELSGLFVLGLAGVVLISGMALSLFIRGR